MKIFAKRSKKKAEPAVSEADKVVLEALKKNPEDLNAKERRLIKRYQDRTKVEQSENDATIGPVQGEDREGDNEQTTGNNDSEVTDLHPDEGMDQEEDISSKSVSQVDPAEPQQDTPGQSDDKADDIDEEEVKKLLDTLNSKNKRKLTRQLERDGLSALKAVREEALKLIEEMKEKEVAVVKEKVKAKKPDPEPISKKRKRDDWSGLPPEERLRREEQRRKQEEAAERRAKGETPPSKHKHPLNSERRRANRRKPKWLKKQVANPNEHDISGFHMRKITKKS
ncbi:hypothetical protein MHU86_8520 [Fragilaria crotonensis]|nr:hypothetical protein MHU86_8520 [Fragilaria crotonensis]